MLFHCRENVQYVMFFKKRRGVEMFELHLGQLWAHVQLLWFLEPGVLWVCGCFEVVYC